VREAAQGIITALRKLDVAYLPPTIGMDYNDMLTATIGIAYRVKTKGVARE